MHWTYDDVRDLPAHIYAVLVEELKREHDDAESNRPVVPDHVM